MTQPHDKKDVNEAFDELLFAEEIAEEKGYKEGYEAGKNQLIRGYHLGYHRASVLAARLGYYYGFLHYHLQNRLFNEKVARLATDLLDIIKKFPKNNNTSVDILQLSEDIKFKFTRLCSLAKIDSSYPESEKIDF